MILPIRARASLGSKGTKLLRHPGVRLLSWLIQWIGQLPPSSPGSFCGDAGSCSFARADAMRTTDYIEFRRVIFILHV